MKRIAPAGYELVRRISPSAFDVRGDTLQKKLSAFHPQLAQSSTTGNPYGVRGFFATETCIKLLSFFAVSKLLAMGTFLSRGPFPVHLGKSTSRAIPGT
jgi:hypothetical protein